MPIDNQLLLLISALVFYNAICLFISAVRQVNNNNTTANTDGNADIKLSSKCIDGIVSTASWIFALCIVVLLIWYLRDRDIKTVVYIGIILACITQRFYDTWDSLGNLKDIIIGNKNTKKENAQYTLVVCSAFYIILLKYLPLEGTIKIIRGSIQITLIQEWLIFGFLFIYLCFYLFFLVTNSFIPIKQLNKLLEKTTINEDILFDPVQKIRKKYQGARLYNKIWDSKAQTFKTIIKIIITPIVVIIDIAILTTNYLIVFVTYSLAVAFSIIIKICKSLKRFISILGSLDYVKILRVSFRISIIISLFIIVVVFKLNDVKLVEERFSSVIEFLASAIIIPVLFEWIFTAKTKEAK